MAQKEEIRKRTLPRKRIVTLTFIRDISPILIRITVTDMIRSVTPVWYHFISSFADHYDIIFFSY